MSKAEEREARLAASVGWLISARWTSFFAQSAAVLAGHTLLGRGPSLLTTAFVISVGAASNAGAAWWTRHRAYRPVTLVTSLILLDVVLLTVLLAMSGGAMNPLNIMYLVYITLAAVMLNSRWTWAAMAICAGCFGALFLLPLRGDLVAGNDMARHMEAMRLHVLSMWWSSVFAAILTAYFGSKLSLRLDAQAADLAAARRASERNERLASLTTLAAGAAHELSTPLSTIAIATEELQRALRQAQTTPAVLDDLGLITRELSRCRGILNRMSVDSGQTVGEVSTLVSTGDVARSAIGTLGPDEARRVALDGELGLEIMAPRAALSQALANLLRNAVEADPSPHPVHLTVRRGADRVAFSVTDHGGGMDAGVLERAGEPFFTTKPAGRGMGLGVFLTRALVEHLGGHVRFDSSPGSGTTAVVELPARGVAT